MLAADCEKMEVRITQETILRRMLKRIKGLAWTGSTSGAGKAVDDSKLALVGRKAYT